MMLLTVSGGVVSAQMAVAAFMFAASWFKIAYSVEATRLHSLAPQSTVNQETQR